MYACMHACHMLACSKPLPCGTSLPAVLGFKCPPHVQGAHCQADRGGIRRRAVRAQSKQAMGKSTNGRTGRLCRPHKQVGNRRQARRPQHADGREDAAGHRARGKGQPTNQPATATAMKQGLEQDESSQAPRASPTHVSASDEIVRQRRTHMAWSPPSPPFVRQAHTHGGWLGGSPCEP